MGEWQEWGPVTAINGLGPNPSQVCVVTGTPTPPWPCLHPHPRPCIVAGTPTLPCPQPHPQAMYCVRDPHPTLALIHPLPGLCCGWDPTPPWPCHPPHTLCCD